MNIREAQRICREVEAQYGAPVKSVKWTQIYSDEQALIKELAGINVPANNIAPAYTYIGYEYVHSFAKRVQDGRELTGGQIKQAKRLALQIHKAYLIREYHEET